MDGGGRRLQLLGGFELQCDGVPEVVPLGSQRVLAFVALRRRPPSRSCIAGTLWPERNEERAAGNLRSAIWRLPQRGRNLLVTTSTHLRLAPAVSCDANDLVERARRLARGAELVDEADLDVASLELDLLPDWSDEWVVAERERIRQLRVHALEAATARLSRAGRHGEAIEAGLAAVTADPFRETAHRAVIEAHLAEQNQAEALRHYRQFRERLFDELGILPSEELDSLVRGATAR